jgi:hypothetical protein
MTSLCKAVAVLIFLVSLAACPAAAGTSAGGAAGEALARAYPGRFTIADNRLVWSDGEDMALDDGIPDKDFATLLNRPDLKDQLRMPYPAGRAYPVPGVDQDPGRVRFQPFFKKMYGRTEQEVGKRLTTIRWLPSSANIPLQVTTVNGVDKRLREVSAALEKLPPDILACARKKVWTFDWRTIAQTDRLSMHSFGIAIDLDGGCADYWQRSAAHPGPIPYRNRLPLEIVEIFEQHGFIWGGKWYHYDTMHFEYRPELLP